MAQTRERCNRQIEFLTTHKTEMTEYIKQQEYYATSENSAAHLKVEIVTFDFKDCTAYQRSVGGMPQNEYTLEITGYDNANQNLNVDVLVDVDSLASRTRILSFERYREIKSKH